ncbi:hypothetical protein [Cryobacterium sp. CG_9.6]|uniref:hypothetical protein n=1 Tax=Cryobacterium sp. CG_9.6 TaxID=2760710 RepID=UPI0024731C9C|nr:hypothetical protein [Cryobacterium sp. CG_9.6]MDH6235818.1 hypothetical protein [Cryobacterium sp. CG_9.6]
MVRRSLLALALAGLAIFFVPTVANADTYVPVVPVSNSNGAVKVTALAATGSDAGAFIWPAVGALGLGLGLVSVPIIRRRRAHT